MNALRRFEDWLGGLIEGRIGALLGQRLEPLDIAQCLARHMEDGRMPGAGRIYVPNHYRVQLSPGTLDALSPYHDALQRELTRFVADHAAERGWSMLGTVLVRCVPNSTLRLDQVQVVAELLGGDDHRNPIDGVTAPIELPHNAPPVAPSLALSMNGRSFILPHGRSRAVALGRALDNDIIIEQGSVSRHHARLQPRGGTWLVEDVGSKHGVFVNERRIVSALLRPGDRLRLGRVVIDVRHGEGDETPPTTRGARKDSGQGDGASKAKGIGDADGGAGR